MPSVDQRVVELEFDNKDFANRVGDTMSSLKQLENALQMGGSAKGISEVNSAIGRMNVNPMLDAAESVANKFSMMRAIAVSAINRITNGVIDAGQKLVGWMPSQVISGGWTRAANVAKAKFTFEGLAKGTSATWEQMSEDINYAVQGTAYTFDAAALAASSFFASGIQQGDQMKQALRGVSGVAAMTSSDYSDIARIFTTVAGNGRLMGEQLNQISSRGINAAATLATKLGITEEEVRDLVSKGKIDFATFAEAMDEAFGEHATEANKTFQGSLANIKAALSKLGEKFAAPLMENMIPVFNGIRNLFSNFKDQVDPIVDVWKNILSTLSPAVSGFFENLAAYVKTDEFAAGIQRIADKFGLVQKAVEGFVKGDKRKALGLDDWKKLSDEPYIDILKDKLVEVASEADSGFKDMYDSYGSFEASLKEGWLTKDIFSKAVDGMKDMAGSLDEVGVSAEDASGYLEQCWKYAREVERGDWGNGIERFNRLTEAGLSYHDIQGLVNHDLLGWDYTLEGLNTTLKESGKYTDEQIAAIEAFARELEDGGSSLNEFMSAFDSVDKMSNFELILGSISNIMAVLKGLFIGVSTAFSQVFLEGKAGEIADFSETLRTWLERLYNWTSGLQDGLKGANGSIVKVYKASKTFFTVLKTIGTGVKKVFEAFLDIGGTLLDTFSPLFDLVVIVFSRLSDLIGKTSGVSTEFTLLDTVLNAVKAGVEAFSSVMKPLLEDFVDWAERTDVVGKAFNAIASAISWAKPKIEYAMSALKSTFEKFWPSIRESLGKVPGILEGVFGKIQEFLAPFSAKISTNFGGVDVSSFSGVGDAFSGLVDSFGEGKGKLESFLNFLGEIFTGALKAVTDFLESFLEVKTEFSSTASTISGDAEDTANKVKDAVDKMSSAGSGLAGIFGEGSVLGTVVSGISTIMSNLWDTVQNITGLLKQVSGMSFEDLFQYFVQGTAVVTMFKYVSAFKSLADALKGFTDIVQGFQEGSNIVSNGLTNIIKSIRPSKFFEIALAIMGLAMSLWLLSTIPAEDLTRAVHAIGGLALAVMLIVGVMALLSKVMDPKSTATFEAMSLSLLALAVALGVMSIAVSLLKDVDQDAFGRLIEMVIALAVSAALVGSYAAGVATGAISMLAMAAAVVILVNAMAMLQSVNPDEGLMTRFLELMLGMAMALAIVGAFNPIGAAVGVIALAAAVIVMVYALKMLSDLQSSVDNFGTSLAVLAGILAAFAIVMLVVAAGLSGCPEAAAALLAFGVACLAVAASVFIIVAALWLLSNLNFENMIQGMVRLYQALETMDCGKFAKELMLVGAGLIIVGLGLAVVGVGIVLIGAGLLVVGLALAVLVAIGPVAAGILVTLGGSMPAFGEGCVAAGKGLIVLGAGLIVAGAGAVVAAVGFGLLSAALLLFAVALAAVMYGLPGLGQAIGSGLISGVASGGASALPGAMGFFKGAGNGILSALSGPLSGGKASGLGKGLFSSFQRNAQSETPGALNVVDVFKSALLGKLNGLDFKGVTSQKGLEIPTGFAEGIESGSPEMMAGMEQLFGTDMQGYLDNADFAAMMQEMGYEGDMSFLEGLGDGSGDISDYLNGDFMNMMNGDLEGLGFDETFADLGVKAVQSMAEAIKATASEVGIGARLISDIVKADLKVDAEPEGQDTSTSYAGGVSSMIGVVHSAVEQIPADQKAQFIKAAVEASIQGTNSIKNYASSIAAKASSARSSAANVASSGVSALYSAVSSFTRQGSSSGSSYASGVGGARSSAYSAGSSVSSSARSGLNTGSAYGIGTSLIQGLINGINARKSAAVSAARAVMSSVNAIMRAVSGIFSPSRVWRSYGEYLVEGLCVGLEENTKDAVEASAGVGKAMLPAILGAQEAIAQAVNEDFEMNPIITPIVDLDNVKAASSMVDSMLSNTYGMGLGATLPNYNLYGNAGLGDSKSTVYNISVALEYQAGTDANLMVNEIASGLRSKLDLEG